MVVDALLAANTVVFAAWQWRSNPRAQRVLEQHFICSPQALREGRWHTLALSTISHYSFMHYAFNMLGLYTLSATVASMLGARRTLLVYACGGVGGALAHCALEEYRERQRTRRSGVGVGTGWRSTGSPGLLGASGATSAFLGVHSVMFPRHRVLVFFVVPLEISVLAAGWFALGAVRAWRRGARSLRAAGHRVGRRARRRHGDRRAHRHGRTAVTIEGAAKETPHSPAGRLVAGAQANTRTRMHTHTHACTHAHACTHMHARAHACMHARCALFACVLCV
jgi:membrane associated rhomboid family serine protease